MNSNEGSQDAKRIAVGKSMPHESAVEHVTGNALYTDDMALLEARALAAWPVLSNVAHGFLKGLNLEDVRTSEGVVLVLTEREVLGVADTGPSIRDEPLFPRPSAAGEHPRILYYGMPLAWVVAENEELAKLAAQKARFEIEALSPVNTIEEAILAQSFLTDEQRLARGDADAELARAERRLQGELFVGGQEHFYLEAQSSFARVDENRDVLVHSSTQHPTETQEIVARVLGLPAHRVIVQALRMGGGFGGKEVQANPFACIAALAAVHTQRPVRIRLDRRTDMMLTGKRHPFLSRFDVGFDASGKIHALKMHLFSDGGYSLDLSFPVLFRAMFHSDNAYFIEHLDVRGRACKTNKASNTAFRGFGGPQGMVMIEEVVDRVARSLNLSPRVVRERNFYQEGQSTHYGMPVKDASRITRIWEELKASSSIEAREKEVLTFNQSNQATKRGIAITPVKFGISFTAKYYNQAGSLVLVYKDGSVQINHGGTEMGQGLHSKMLQVAADSLGVQPSSIRVMPTRTDKVPNTSATAASAGTDLNGAAVRDACLQIKARLIPVAAQMIGCAKDEVRFEDGRVFGTSSDKNLSFGELTYHAYHDRVQLSANGFYKTPDLTYDPKTGKGSPFYYFAYGACVSEVEVDRFTGMYSLRRVDILHDVGESISPLIDRGQVEGAFAQGMGWLTQEELVWDGKAEPKTLGASTYKLPTLHECPPEFHVNLLTRAHQDGVIFGSKAVGEPPFMLAIAVREALKDAVAAFRSETDVDNPASQRKTSVVNLKSPATPEAVYFAIQQHS